MKPTDTSIATLEDLIFEHRNRSYGAYLLRATYAATLRRATALGIVLTTTGLLMPTLYARYAPALVERHVVMNVAALAVPPPIKEELKLPEPPAALKQPPSTKYLPPQIELDNKVIEDEIPPTQTELSEAPAGQETVAGDPDAFVEVLDSPAAPSHTVVTIEPTSQEPLLFVEQQPEFPGGLAALTKFLGNHIKYPQAAAKAGVAGRVFLSFIVGADGRITNVEVSKGVGFGCDEEALRVVRLMPAWKPGRQAGRAVPVRFTLPVFFQLE